MQHSLNDNLFKKSSSFHFVGIGGIGMSGLAQFLVAQGHQVTGSDRGADQKENETIFNPLIKQGIKIFPQDGSFCDDTLPDALVFSSAIENDNPDFLAAERNDLVKIHRANALAMAICHENKIDIAVTGSCGKTTVTSWLGETLHLLNHNPVVLSGGLINRFISDAAAGNYVDGNGKYFVFEADESDKSLIAYQPDYAIILNIGTDHYSKDELIAVFKTFLANVKCGVAVEASVYHILGKDVFKGLDVRVFSANGNFKGKVDFWLESYEVKGDAACIQVSGDRSLQLPFPGVYNAENALAVIALLDLLNVEIDEHLLQAVKDFKGVWRRFNFIGRNKCGLRIYDDYAHNVEKIVSSLKTAREICSGKLVILFQPHGYGPLGFMQEPLFAALEDVLDSNTVFALLPVFYAGGTTSFKPTSEDVIKDFLTKTNHCYISFENREQAKSYISNLGKEDLVVIMGARDNSLADWAEELTYC